ncbi:MAG: hypothetical protein K0Q55_969 [Verrucomicrobia bacterium]|jgi:hypothetical protein|nr:hypothetical protein [Verrucomicrobiota bacterium]
MDTWFFSFRPALTLVCAALVASTTGCVSPKQTGSRYSERVLRSAAGSPDPLKAIRESMTFATTFDKGLDAEFAKGDAKLYHAANSRSRTNAVAGLPAGDDVKRTEGAGRFGAALEFTKKTTPVVFYRGATNINYTTNNWHGTASFWMRLDPDKDLAPGYCDPLQYVAQTWTEGAMFVEFSKDETPRHFRYAIMAQHKLWNPNNRKWEEIPVSERPMVQVEKPPFNREKWTHVVFTFEHANTGRKDGIGKLYLDGEYKGSFAGFNNTLKWDPAQSALNLGLAYVGFLDEIALFDRALNAEEVRIMHHLPNGAKDLLYRHSDLPFVGPRKWLAKDNHFR